MHKQLLHSAGAVSIDGKHIGSCCLLSDRLLLATLSSRDAVRARDRTRILFANESSAEAICLKQFDTPIGGLDFALLELGTPRTETTVPKPARILSDGMSIITIEVGQGFQAHEGKFSYAPGAPYAQFMSDSVLLPDAGWPVFTLDTMELIGITSKSFADPEVRDIQIVPFDTIINASHELRHGFDLAHFDESNLTFMDDRYIEEIELDNSPSDAAEGADVRGPTLAIGDSSRPDAVSDVPEIRYPAAQLIQIEGGEHAPVGTLDEFHSPATVEQYALEFWLSTQSEGVDYDGDRPGFSPPAQSVYPIALRIEVWSEDLTFQNQSHLLTLHAHGKSEKARFVIETIRQSARINKTASVFLFVRTASSDGEKPGDLVAVFRFESSVGETNLHQTLEHAYLAPDWFGFAEKPHSSAKVTLYVRKQGGMIQIFTCITDEPTWGAVEIGEFELFEHTRRAYVEVLRLSIDSAKREAAGKTLPLKEAYHSLVPLGHALYSKLFYSAEDPLWKLGHRLASPDLDDATMVIALDQTSSDLVVPWGLLFDSSPAISYGTIAPPSNRFWGLRFRLVVRPSSTGRSMSISQFPLSLATLYGKHAQVPDQLKFVSELEVDHTPLKAMDNGVPEFATQTFDILHLYCHGHSEVPKDLSNELLNEYRKYATGLAGESEQRAATEYLMSRVGIGSYFEPEGGIVPLNTIKERLSPRRKIAHLVLLSMCESAQMTCSGDGFVRFFLRRGAQAVVGTEGPTLWSLGREMDRLVLAAVVNDGKTIADAVFEAKRALAPKQALALIYTVYGNPNLRFRRPLVDS